MVCLGSMKIFINWILKLGIICVLVVVFIIVFKQNSRQKKIYSQVLKENRTVLVHLPAGYEDTGRKYPVLMLLDGGDVKSFSGDKTLYTRAIDFLDKKSLPGEGIILIGVANKNRSRDMIPVKAEYHIQSGGAEKFLAFITSELIPWIKDNYRTSEQFIIYGQSDAGLFVLYALLKNPDPFYGFICVSPTIGVCKDFMHSLARNFNPKIIPSNKHFYLAWGSNDYPLVIGYVPGFLERFSSLLNQTFIWKSEEIPNAGHNPDEALGSGLEWIFSRGKN